MLLLDVVWSQKRGEPRGAFSVCSANRLVLEAAMARARRDGTSVLIETTSNQVNQDGGYSGMKPADFVAFAHGLAREVGLPTERVILGGDHIGPHVWRRLPASLAMARAHEMVRQYVAAGYGKIHLDASMRLADDPPVLADAVVTERTAILCRAAEAAWHAHLPHTAPPPVYVIGTDVPPPGGEPADGERPRATEVADLERTIWLARGAFRRRGLDDAWRRVVAVVVQPGVDFSDGAVFPYDREQAQLLSARIRAEPQLVFEAHSTDYQTAGALRHMVEDGFAILKVGPALTFAMREAIFALAAIEEEWLEDRAGVELSQVREALEVAMLRRPEHWRDHYAAEGPALRLACRYSYSDRSRYYWPAVEAELARLFGNLRQHPPPLTLLSQFLPGAYRAVADGRLSADPEALVRHRIDEAVLDPYATACAPPPAQGSAMPSSRAALAP